MTLSFIIPVYNGSEYIVRCLDSITKLAIPEKDYEVIVVDDCSTDNTRYIVREYISSHKQVRLICQPENHRQGAARNRGLKEARGVYIYYVDADDEVMPGGVANALDYASRNQLDVCYCGVECQLKNGEFEPMRFKIPSPLLLSGKQLGEEYADEICTGPWAYLWRLEHLKRINYSFVENLRIEDADYVDHNIVLANKVGCLDTIIYRYHYTPDSTVNTCNYDTVSDWVLAAYRRMRFHDTIRSEHPVFTQKRDFQCRCWVQSCMSLRRLTRITTGQIHCFFKKIGQESLTYFYKKGEWPLWQRLCLHNPNMAAFIISVCSPFAQVGRFFVHNIRAMYNMKLITRRFR